MNGATRQRQWGKILTAGVDCRKLFQKLLHRSVGTAVGMFFVVIIAISFRCDVID